MTHSKPDSYLDVLLQRHHNVAYALPTQGNAPGYLFLKVVDYEDSIVAYNEYNVLTTESASATIGSATTGTDWNRWKLNSNSTYDIFKESMAGFMIQAFIGIDPPSLKLWKQFPAGITRGNLDQTKITALNDDAPGFLTGEEWGSPFDMPSALSEMLIPSNFQELMFGVYNPENISVMPRFKVPMRRMKMQAYKPRESPEDKNTVNDIISGKRACKVFSPGMDGFQYNTKEQYGVDPIPWRTIA